MVNNIHLVFYGYDLEFRGLKLDQLDKINLRTNPDYEFLPGHKYLVVYNDSARNETEQPFKIIESKGIHYGPRRENHSDYVKCPYLTTRHGIIFKFIYKKYETVRQFLDKPNYEAMLASLDQIKLKLRNANLTSDISKRTGKEYYLFTYERLKDIAEDVSNFIDREDYIKEVNDIKFIKRIRSKEDIINSFDYFINKPDDTIFGLDYETAFGMPFEDESFEPVGLGIACCDDDASAAYYDLQWMIHFSDGSELEVFKEYFNKFLDKFENSVTYNNFFEMRVTYLLLNRICLFDEAASVNKCDGRVHKRFSLKYTVQCVLGHKSWDDDFDLLTGELLPSLFSWNEDTEEYDWKLVADGENEIESSDLDEEGNPIMIKVPNDYKHNPVWNGILTLFPDEKDEFEKLITNFYGEPFACIPSNIQAQYCCRDSYYTGLLKVNALQRYTELCYETYNNNLKLESLLHLTGFFCDEDLRLKMVLQCLWLQVYGKLNVTRWAVAEKLKLFKDSEAQYIPGVTELIKQGYDPCNSKPIIMNHLSDTSESGLDEDALLKLLGSEVLDIYKRYVKEYCYRIDESYSRSRKVFNELNSELETIYNPVYAEDDSYVQYTINDVTYTIYLSWELLQEYYKLESDYALIVHFCNQLNFSQIEKLLLDHLGQYELPDHLIDPTGVEYTLQDILDFCDDCFNYKSVKVAPYLKFMVYNKFKGILFHAFDTGYESLPLHHKTEINKDEYDSCVSKEYTPVLLENTANELLQEDLEILKTKKSYRYFESDGDLISLLYRGITEDVTKDQYGRTVGLYQHTATTEKDSEGHTIYGWSVDMDNWYNDISVELTSWFDFLLRYVGYWSLSGEDKEVFHRDIDNINIEDDTVAALAKLNYCFTSAKKYDKVLGTYLTGKHFYEFNYNNTYFGEDGVTPKRYQQDNVHRCYLPFNANEKKSKRWASAFHTIPSKSEMKRIVTTPPGYLLSYFDISGAEIRTISFLSQDPFMMQCYKDGKDPYITMARFAFPEEEYDPDEHDGMDYEDYLKSWRGCFKQVLLGSLYGMGEEKMAEVAEIEVELARKLLNDLWERCPVLKEFIEKKSTWAEEHPGYIESALGDVVELGEDDGEDRYARLGINQFIQNFSSVSLADGFYNNFEKSIHHTDEKLNAKDFILRPAGVVHDSCQILFPTKYLFEMNEYYTRNLTGYLYDVHKILYAFDLEVGTNYYDMLELSQKDDTHMVFKGNYTAINSFLKKLTSDGLAYRVMSMKTNPKHDDPEEIEVIDNNTFGDKFKPKYYNSVIDQFFDNNCFACFHRDKSKFKVEIEKL